MIENHPLKGLEIMFQVLDKELTMGYVSSLTEDVHLFAVKGSAVPQQFYITSVQAWQGVALLEKNRARLWMDMHDDVTKRLNNAVEVVVQFVDELKPLQNKATSSEWSCIPIRTKDRLREIIALAKDLREE